MLYSAVWLMTQFLQSQQPRHKLVAFGSTLGGTMDSKVVYLLAADLLLITHTLFVAFVIFGLIFVLVGKLFSWRGIRNRWFRLVHLTAIGVVVLQSWLGIVCPLTTWEMALREKAGDVVYAGTFVSHWLETILYFSAPAWVFVLCYTIFGMLVLASWFWVRPDPFTVPKNNDAT